MSFETPDSREAEISEDEQRAIRASNRRVLIVIGLVVAGFAIPALVRIATHLL